MDRRGFLKLGTAAIGSTVLPTLASAAEAFSESTELSGASADWGVGADHPYYTDPNYGTDYTRVVSTGGPVKLETSQDDTGNKSGAQQELTQVDDVDDWGLSKDHPYYTDPLYGTDYQELAEGALLPEAA